MPATRATRSHAPAAHEPPVPSARALVEYRFTVAHTHAGRTYRAGHIIECDQAAADAIRGRAGDSALERVRARRSAA